MGGSEWTGKQHRRAKELGKGLLLVKVKTDGGFETIAGPLDHDLARKLVAFARLLYGNYSATAAFRQAFGVSPMQLSGVVVPYRGKEGRP